MKTLPRNICAHPDGLLVRVKRGAVLFQAFVGGSSTCPIALARALALRDKFIKLAGPAKRPQQVVRSNTGIAGVSETTMWRHDRPYPCFIVSWSHQGKPSNKRFVYGQNGVSRTAALQRAIALRQEKEAYAR